jgi:hypothetical protein
VLRYEVVEKNSKKLLVSKRSSKRIGKISKNICDESFDYKLNELEGLFQPEKYDHQAV